MASWLLASFMFLWAMEKGTQGAKHASKQGAEEGQSSVALCGRKTAWGGRSVRWWQLQRGVCPHRQDLGAGNLV